MGNMQFVENYEKTFRHVELEIEFIIQYYISECRKIGDDDWGEIMT